MARAKKKAGGSNVPEWLVTFADLMSILVCFFVLIISFSIQDKEKLQVVAGSMREAFGVKPFSKKAGMIEREGAPVRRYVKNIEVIPRDENSEYAEERHDQRQQQGPEANTHDIEKTDIERPRQFATAAASLRQAWQEMPEINELSDHIMVEETPEGLNIQLVDQDGRSMFPEGSAQPYERTRQLLIAMAPTLRELPNRISIIGHTNARRIYGQGNFSQWELSAARANAVRRTFAEAGIPHDQFFSVSGRADTEPLFPNDPFLSANRRVNILLMAEAPPIPQDYTLTDTPR